MSGSPRRGEPFSRLNAALGAALACCLVLALLTGIIRLFATSAGLMEDEMRRFAPPERTGLPEAEYAPMAAHIAEYLAGRGDSFQYTLTAQDGTVFLCFHDYELAHMSDCQSLIRLDGLVFCACLAAAMLSGGLLLCRKSLFRPDARRGARACLAAMGILTAGICLWAFVNFDGLFITFHRLAFRNDLWLLNPRTDLLIRLMPQAMFIDLGIRGLGLFTLCAAALWGVLHFLCKR